MWKVPPFSAKKVKINGQKIEQNLISKNSKTKYYINVYQVHHFLSIRIKSAPQQQLISWQIRLHTTVIHLADNS